MSRVGRQPIPIPAGVSVKIDSQKVAVKGKLGELNRTVPEGIAVKTEGNQIIVTRRDDSWQQKSLHGLSRSLIANMLKGVSEGYKKDLEVIGVGYRIEQRGPAIQLQLGFSHRILFFPPDGVNIKVGTANLISVSGIDNALVGDVAAKIRAIRPPEPYKGKGIKYVGEYVRHKAGKSAGK
ncbi:MAG: 50S ribosomal protein L6 [Calditrichaeota bacterium]|nr:50S ribosomal protein L6 [Calditrichota bacterium]